MLILVMIGCVYIIIGSAIVVLISLENIYRIITKGSVRTYREEYHIAIDTLKLIILWLPRIIIMHKR